MKKNKSFGELYHGSLKKILKIMRNALILLFIGVLQAHAIDTYSQKTRLSLNFSDTELSKVLDKIEAESEFYFLYNEKLLDSDRKVSINENDQLISMILDDLFVGTDVKYTIIDRKIILAPGFLTEVSQVQQLKISGIVIGTDGSPLPGVNVIVTGTTQGVMTDISGKYTIEVPQGAKSLTFSFIGMESQEIILGTLSEINVTMKESAVSLDEVMVIGYGTIKRTDLTGSVASVKGDKITLQGVGNPVQALAGVASGVQVIQTSGQPGSDLNVLIRGGNSLLGSNEPLYIVDGAPMVAGINILNNNDIESIEILKDASATAIYGSRGANGIVLVTTKKGKEGKPVFEYNGYYGVQQVMKTIDMLNAQEYATLANVRAVNDGEAPYFTPDQIASFGEGTNWQNKIFRLAPIQNHSLRLSGGNDRTTYNISGSYFDQKGIIINSGYKNLQLRSNIETKISKNWKLSLNSIFSRRENNNIYSNNTERGRGVLSAALGIAPTIPVYDDNGKYSNVRPYGFSPEGLENAVAMARERKQGTHSNDLYLNMFTNGNITKDLVLYSSLGVQYENMRGDLYSPSILLASQIGDASISYSDFTNIVNENTLTYSKKFNENHNLTVMGGLTSQINTVQSVVAGSTGFLTDKLENFSLQSGSNSVPPNSAYSNWTLLSYLGRINYSFKNKYLITSSFRADGSSRFGRDNKWGYFPSAALAWKVNEEDFLKDFKTINNLKLRASWGQTGSTAVAPYQSLSVLQSVRTVFDDNIVIGYAPGGSMANPKLKWERTDQINAGIDIGLYSDRIIFSADIYHKKTSDILVNIPVLLSSGYANQITNLGDIQNNGFELSLNSRILNGPVTWSLGGNISANHNKVLNLPKGGDIFGPSIGYVLPSMSLVREGYPVGVFYGYVEDGIAANGSIQYSDLNGDGVITSADRTIIGDPNPKFIFGISSDLSYRNFGLSILVNGVQGNDILNYNLVNLEDSFGYGLNQMKEVLGNYWTAENPDPNAKFPRISKNTRYLGSNRFIEDGSYVQIKSIKLSYTLKGDKFESLPIKNSQIYLSVQNVATFTKYSFYSPIQNTYGGGISKGIDQYGYPDTRTIMMGVIINL
jgi:TonB-dependent starch-binding outer membrane protein SusC